MRKNVSYVLDSNRNTKSKTITTCEQDTTSGAIMFAIAVLISFVILFVVEVASVIFQATGA